MNRFGPAWPDLHVVIRSKQEAVRHERRSHNVPDDVGLGWTPYTILVSSAGGALAHTAFHSVAEFRRWLTPQFKVVLRGGYCGLRYGRIVRAKWFSIEEQPGNGFRDATAADILRDNAGDEEVCNFVRTAEVGESRTFGGGAAPSITLTRLAGAPEVL